MRTKLITAPTAEPITVDEAKSHLNVTSADDDTYIGSLIAAARRHAEAFTRRAFLFQTWDVLMDEFSSEIGIPIAPLQSVTSVKYIDTDGAEQTVATSVYAVDDNADPGVVHLDYGQSWPAARRQRNAVTIRVVAGYEDPDAAPESSVDVLPDDIKQAMLLHIGHMYEHRESVSDFQTHNVPMSYESLLYPHRVIRF